MKNRLFTFPLAVVLAVGAVAVADHHGKSEEGLAWFDAQNCVICKPMGKDPSLLMSMKWETHKLENGMLMVSVVPADKMEDFAVCCAEIEKIAEKVAGGKVPDAVCCGFCNAYGEVLQAGAKEQKVKTKFGSISIVTGESPETVKKIHEMADRTIEEAKKWESTTSAEG